MYRWLNLRYYQWVFLGMQSDQQLIYIFVHMCSSQDGIALRLMKASNNNSNASDIIEVRLHLLGDQELSWLTGSLNLLEVVDILSGKPAAPSGTFEDPLEVSVVVPL
jgi:hypothetical protein